MDGWINGWVIGNEMDECPFIFYVSLWLIIVLSRFCSWLLSHAQFEADLLFYYVTYPVSVFSVWLQYASLLLYHSFTHTFLFLIFLPFSVFSLRFQKLIFSVFFSVVGLLVSWLIFLGRIALFYPVTLSHSFILLLSILFSKTKLPFQIELIWVSSAFSCFWSFCWLVVWWLDGLVNNWLVG